MTRRNKRFHARRTNKTELIKIVARKSGFTQNEVHQVLNSLTDAIIEEVSDGSRVNLQGFGTFELRFSSPKNYQNPKTREKSITDAKIVPCFDFGKKISDAVKNNQQKLISVFNTFQ